MGDKATCAHCRHKCKKNIRALCRVQNESMKTDCLQSPRCPQKHQPQEYHRCDRFGKHVCQQIQAENQEISLKKKCNRNCKKGKKIQAHHPHTQKPHQYSTISAFNDDIVPKLEEFNGRDGKPKAKVHLHYDRSKVVSLEPETLNEFRIRLINLINESRKKRSVHPLKVNTQLQQMAMYHTEDQAVTNEHCSHSGSDGSTLSMRVIRSGYDYAVAGENVARGQTSPEHVHSSFMKSPGHKQTLLHPQYEEVGIHVCKSLTGEWFWTENFGTKRKR